MTTATDVGNVYAASTVSRTKWLYLAVVELEPTGELSVLTRGGEDKGYASAHRQIAREFFGVPVVRVIVTGFESTSGEALVLTTWLPKPGRVPVDRTVIVNAA
ncbi:hypothetical protein [Nocardia salmonicida]|uniref:hypothetical protein n=1 Tax=Nocardia salmonicida TaxID=53431 RepID=UPI0037B35AE8